MIEIDQGVKAAPRQWHEKHDQLGHEHVQHHPFVFFELVQSYRMYVLRGWYGRIYPPMYQRRLIDREERREWVKEDIRGRSEIDTGKGIVSDGYIRRRVDACEGIYKA